MKTLFLIIFIFATSLLGKTINIAVAANVSYAIKDLTKEFNKLYPETKIRVTLGSSGKLTAQIKNGAPYSLFMSANMLYPNSLYKDNFAIIKPTIYAQGSLALISSQKKEFSKGLDLLKNSSIKKIAIANPKTAPYGIATQEALKNIGLYKDLKAKFIYGESISQTLLYALKAADYGFVAKSSLYGKQMRRFKENIHWVSVDTKLFTPIEQGVVLIKKDAQEFYNFLLSKKAKEIFKKYGYITNE